MNRIAAAIMWLGGAVMVNMAMDHQSGIIGLAVGGIGALIFFVIGFLWLFTKDMFTDDKSVGKK